MDSILVTGGTGYIGSHVVRQLGELGKRVVVLDALLTSSKSALLYGDLIIGSVNDRETVAYILDQYNVDTIMHFAAHTIVSESVSNPLKYYANNAGGTQVLLECAANQRTVKRFIFSSSAAVYGIPDSGYASEDSPTNPINPYGTSKLMSEWMIRDACAVSNMSYVSLRYFNVAGADPKGRIGQSTPEPTLLIKIACEAAVGKRPSVSLFGTDYNTPDGTAIRDYIHVEDLATAHIQALDYLKDGGASTILNCGYGWGHSVREILSAVEEASGKQLNIIEADRRPGDPDILIAVTDKIRHELNWFPMYQDLKDIIESSLKWEQR